MASAPIVIPPMANITSAAIQTPSASEEANARVELASKRHFWAFVYSVAWVVVAGLIAALLSWRVWRAGNEEQSAIADAASERISIVERDAADAKIDLEKQREETAKAQAETLALRKAVLEPRHFSPEAWEKAKEILRKGQKGTASISYVGVLDARVFASMIAATLKDCGWNVVKLEPLEPSDIPPNPGTLLIFSMEMWREQATGEELPSPVNALYRALMVGNPETGTIIWQGGLMAKGDPIRIVVGPKF